MNHVGIRSPLHSGRRATWCRGSKSRAMQVGWCAGSSLDRPGSGIRPEGYSRTRMGAATPPDARLSREPRYARSAHQVDALLGYWYTACRQVDSEESSCARGRWSAAEVGDT